MRALVTGGAGFIGSHLTENLIDDGCDVLVLDDLSRGREGNVPQGAQLETVRIESDAAARAVEQFAPEVIFHLAAQIDVRVSVGKPAVDATTNVVGTVNLLQAAVAAKTQSFVLASTGGAIYGEQDAFPATEEHPCRPVSPYGTSKRCAENYLDYFSRMHPLRCVSLRYANVYGPRQDPHGEAGVVAIFASKMLSGTQPTIFGDGKQTRDYVHVDDVVRANVSAWQTHGARGPINIATGVETNVITLAEGIARACGYSGGVAHGPGLPGEQRRSVLDNTKAQNLLGWRPATSLGGGLQQTVDWFRHHA